MSALSYMSKFAIEKITFSETQTIMDLDVELTVVAATFYKDLYGAVTYDDSCCNKFYDDSHYRRCYEDSCCDEL